MEVFVDRHMLRSLSSSGGRGRTFAAGRKWDAQLPDVDGPAAHRLASGGVGGDLAKHPAESLICQTTAQKCHFLRPPPAVAIRLVNPLDGTQADRRA